MPEIYEEQIYYTPYISETWKTGYWPSLTESQVPNFFYHKPKEAKKNVTKNQEPSSIAFVQPLDNQWPWKATSMSSYINNITSKVLSSLIRPTIRTYWVWVCIGGLSTGCINNDKDIFSWNIEESSSQKNI